VAVLLGLAGHGGLGDAQVLRGERLGLVAGERIPHELTLHVLERLLQGRHAVALRLRPFACQAQQLPR
jgi:hypothetical protein